MKNYYLYSVNFFDQFRRMMPLKYLCIIITAALLLLPILLIDNAESNIITNPSQLLINGSLGKDLFQSQFNVTAMDHNITNLTFKPSNLKMEFAGGPLAPSIFIPSTSILVSGEKNIISGKTEQYLVSVNNIPGSGRYTGKLKINYENQSIDADEFLSVSLLAYKMNASSSLIIIPFENGILDGLGGTENFSYELKLNRENGLIPPDVAQEMIKGLDVSLTELTNSDKTSKINSADILGSVGKRYVDNGSILLNFNFKNNQFIPGKYTGNVLIGLNGSLQPLAVVPVELRVRSNMLFAIFLILIGVFGYLILTNWNTTGKEKNDIERHILDIRTKMSDSVSNQCCDKIERILSEVSGFIHDKNLADARKKIVEAESELKGCEDAKKKLAEKANDVDQLNSKLDNLKKLARSEFKNWEIELPVNSNILRFISGAMLLDLNYLKYKFNVVSNIDEKKWDGKTDASITDLFKEYDTNIQNLYKLVDAFREIRCDLASNRISKDSRDFLNKCIKAKDAMDFIEINTIGDINTVSGNLQKRKSQLEDKEQLNLVISEYFKLSQKSTVEEAFRIKLDGIRNALCNYAKSDDICKKLQEITIPKPLQRVMIMDAPSEIAVNSLGNHVAESVDKAIYVEIIDFAKNYKSLPKKEVALEPTSEVVSQVPVIKSLKADKGKTEEIETIDGKKINFWKIETKEGEKITWSCEVLPVADKRTLFKFIFNGKERSGWKADNTWIWTPNRMDAIDNLLEVKAMYEGGQEGKPEIKKIRWIRQKKGHIDMIRDEIECPEFLSPKWKELIMKIVLWTFVTGSLTLVGYVQLYEGNPTFGAGNTLMEYLSLIFWGFGIQASTSKAVDIVKALSGS